MYLKSGGKEKGRGSREDLSNDSIEKRQEAVIHPRQSALIVPRFLLCSGGLYQQLREMCSVREDLSNGSTEKPQEVVIHLRLTPLIFPRFLLCSGLYQQLC